MDTEVNMKTYDVKCPVCGSMNHSLYLEETEGWMECSCCGCTARYLRDRREAVAPALVIRNLKRQAVPAV